MKQLLTILCLVLLSSYSYSEEVPYSKLVERQGITYKINSTTPFTGSSVSYHDNGQLESRGNYKNGRKEGLSEKYHDNGQLEWRRNYKDELVEDGPYESFHSNGQLERRGNYKDGKEHGPYETFWKKNGQTLHRGNYKDGKEHGLSESFHCNGQ